MKLHQYALAVGLLSGVGCPAHALPAPILIEGVFSHAASLPWQGAAAVNFSFAGHHETAGERPFFAALGTLVSSRGQLFSDTLQQVSWACDAPVAGCTGGVYSALRFTQTASGAVLGSPGFFGSTTGISLRDYPAAEVDFLPSWHGRVTGTPGSGWGFDDLVAPKESVGVAHHLTTTPGWTVRDHGPEWTYDSQLELAQTYLPFTRGRYVADAVAAARGTGVQGERSVVAAATGYVYFLRNTSAGTSGNNLGLRDAEYGLYGFDAGMAVRDHQAPGLFRVRKAGQLDATYDRAIFHTPVFAGGYGVAKQMLKVGLIGDAVAYWFNTASDGRSTPLPGTTDAMGGTAANARAFLHGFHGGTADGLGACLDDAAACATLFAPNRVSTPLRLAFAPAADAGGAPVTPSFSEAGMVDGAALQFSIFDITSPVPGQDTELLLPAAPMQMVHVLGNRLARISLVGSALPAGLQLGFHDGGGVQLVSFADGMFDFLAAAPQGVDGFVLWNPSAMPASTDWGLRVGLVGDGPASVQVLSATPVPEPGSAALLLVGLAGMLGLRGCWRPGLP